MLYRREKERIDGLKKYTYIFLILSLLLFLIESNQIFLLAIIERKRYFIENNIACIFSIVYNFYLRQRKVQGNFKGMSYIYMLISCTTSAQLARHPVSFFREWNAAVKCWDRTYFLYDTCLLFAIFTNIRYLYSLLQFFFVFIFHLKHLCVTLNQSNILLKLY